MRRTWGDDVFFLYGSFWGRSEANVYSRSNKRATKAIPITSSNGERLFQSSDYGPMAIMETSQNKELAWEFIKMQIEEFELSDYEFDGMEQDFFHGGIPVNKNNSRKLMEMTYGDGHEEEIKAIEDWTSQLNRHAMMTENSDLSYAIYHICEEYYTDLISAEECAKKVQERVYMFLNE